MIVAAAALTVSAVTLPYGPVLCVAFTAAIAAMGIFELVRLFARDLDTLSYRPVAGTIMYSVFVLPSVVATLSAVQSVLFGVIWWKVIYVATLVSCQGMMIGLAVEGRERLEVAATFAQRYAVGFLLASVCMPAMIIVSGLPNGLGLIWWIAGCVALNDIAAYFVGRAWGARKMAPGLSPKKTVEGSLAGLIVGSVSGVALWRSLVGESGALWQVLLVSLAVVVAAQVGDLVKSYLKRLRGVKDFGALFPGHGGVLDRFDALIAAAPVALVALCLLGMV
jgi:phosphatidate cytidylyltransferase